MHRISISVICVFSILFYGLIIGCSSNQETEKSKVESSFKTHKNFTKSKNNLIFSDKIGNNLIPEKAYEIRDYVRKKGESKIGYIGGRKFKNLEKRLPIFSNNHLKISYQEWDVNKKTYGKNRGRERLITGSDGSDYFTNDHYQSFQKLKEN